MALHSYTPEQVEFLRAGYATMPIPALTTAFNARFGLAKTEGAIKAALGNRGITSGRTGRLEKGQQPWNKGVKGYMGSNATSFRPGNMPHNKKRLWSERVNKDGFIEISVPERNPHTGFPTRYRHKHVWLWEYHNGPVPKGHVVAFVDGNPLNCEPENFMLLTRAELLCLNLHNYKEAPAALRPSILALARLEAKAGVRTRPGQGRKRREDALAARPEGV